MAGAALKQAVYADLEALPETVVGEIIDGVLETHPRPRPRHARALGRLNNRLTSRFEEGEGEPGGWVFLIEPEVHLGSHIVVPDICGWRIARLPAEPPTAFVDVAPDWVCEILSPSTARLDRGSKRRIYAMAGVSHYWLLDPSAGELEVAERAGRQWLLLATVQRGEPVQAAPFDAVSFALNDLFPFDPPDPPSTEA